MFDRLSRPRPNSPSRLRSIAAHIAWLTLGSAVLLMAVLGATPPSSGGTPQAWVNAVRTAAPKPAPGTCLDVRYEGVVDLEGHLRRPGQTLRYHSSRRFVSNGSGAI